MNTCQFQKLNLMRLSCSWALICASYFANKLPASIAAGQRRS
jgi:hypothetical protein